MMSEENPTNPSSRPPDSPAASLPNVTSSPGAPATGAASGPTINIGDEFGTAKRNLPPAKIVLLAIAAVLVVVGIASFLHRARPQASGSLDNVAAAEISGQGSTLVALTFTLRNTADKTLYVHNIEGKLKTATGEFGSEAVSAVDFDRYFLAFPALKSGAQPALSPEAKLQPGEGVTRTVIMAFPVTLEAFNQRHSVSVIVQPYDQPVPIVLTK
jgi:hypothetical protein